MKQLWRRHQHGPVSVAEEKIFTELQRRGLCTYLTTQAPFIFDLKKDIVAGTTVDFLWSNPFTYAVFVDGKQIHLKSRQERRDKLVTAALERRGVRVERFMYNPPLPDYRRDQICDKIQFVLENGKQ